MYSTRYVLCVQADLFLRISGEDAGTSFGCLGHILIHPCLGFVIDDNCMKCHCLGVSCPGCRTAACYEESIVRLARTVDHVVWDAVSISQAVLLACTMFFGGLGETQFEHRRWAGLLLRECSNATNIVIT